MHFAWLRTDRAQFFPISLRSASTDIHKLFHHVVDPIYPIALLPFSDLKVNMPRGNKWTKGESIALVEAYVHISEDAIIGVNQAADTLYLRIAAEAKTRYRGDWKREPAACKSRWHHVSRHVQKFIAAFVLIESVPQSGWNDEMYYQAAVMAYHKKEKPEMDMDEVDPDSLSFDFKEEWEILKDHEKWRTSLSKHEQNQKKKRSSLEGTACRPPSDSGSSDDEVVVVDRPTGMKKAKVIQGLTEKTEVFMQEMKRQKTKDNSVVTDLMALVKSQGDEAIVAIGEATATLKMLNTTVAEGNEKLNNTLNHALGLKDLMRSDVSKMSSAEKERVTRARANHLLHIADVENAKYA